MHDCQCCRHVGRCFIVVVGLCAGCRGCRFLFHVGISYYVLLPDNVVDGLCCLLCVVGVAVITRAVMRRAAAQSLQAMMRHAAGQAVVAAPTDVGDDIGSSSDTSHGIDMLRRLPQLQPQLQRQAFHL